MWLHIRLEAEEYHTLEQGKVGTGGPLRGNFTSRREYDVLCFLDRLYGSLEWWQTIFAAEGRPKRPIPSLAKSSVNRLQLLQQRLWTR